MREFTAPDGRMWRVWQVVPTCYGTVYDRPRHRERRGQDVLLYKGPERRRSERRKGLPAMRPVVIVPELQRGWLTFESGGVKRRLAPPPPHWEQLTDAELVRAWAQASPVGKLP